MKKLLIVFITLVFAIKGIAQTIETAVSGSTVVTKNVPIESATISFSSYCITTSAVSFAKINSPVFIVSENNTTHLSPTVRYPQ